MREVNDSRMTLGEHFEELRKSLWRAVLGVAIGMGLCLLVGEYIMQVMCWPVAVAQRYTGSDVQLRVLAPAESFTTYLKVCLIWGAILAAPYSLYQLWQFVAAGLYPRERRYVERLVPFSAGLFFLGVAFFFLIVAPMVLVFFINFGRDNFASPAWRNPLWNRSAPATQPATQPVESAPVVPLLAADPPGPVEGQFWRVAEAPERVRVFLGGRVRELQTAAPTFLNTELTLAHYMTFVSMLSLVFGLGFQVPVVVLMLVSTGLMSLPRLRAARKYVVLLILIVAALLTPPDITSQIALGVPMYLLYELGLLLARRTKRAGASEPDAPQENRHWL